MKKNGSLESRIKSMKRGDVIEVKTLSDRAAAYRIALRNGFNVITRAKLFGKGYEVVKA